LVFVVRANPKPDERVPILCGEGAIITTHPRRPENVPHRFEMQGWMPMIFLQQQELFVRQFPNVIGQAIVFVPKLLL
jgi:hypothetical protein